MKKIAQHRSQSLLFIFLQKNYYCLFYYFINVRLVVSVEYTTAKFGIIHFRKISLSLINLL